MSDMELKDARTIGPYDHLLSAIQSNDLTLFKRLLEVGLDNSSIDLEHEYEEPYHGNILDICSSSIGRSEFVELLLSFGMEVNVMNKNRKKAPIHLAAANGCKDTINVLLNHPPINVNLLDGDGNSALHLAAKTGNVECIELLLDADGVKANQLNRKGFSPAYLAATSKSSNEKAVKVFIKCPEVDLDLCVWDKPVRNIIKEKYPDLIELMPSEGARKVVERSENPFAFLYSNDPEGFISHISSLKQPDLNAHDGRHTYLQYACDFGLPEVVKLLLRLDADPNATCISNKKFPVLIASFRGFADIVELFINSHLYINYSSKSGTALHEVVKGSDENHNSLDVNTDLCDHLKCFNILLNKSEVNPLELDINQQDDKGNTCLHYAAKVGDRDYIMTLLEHGAYVGKKNILGDPPLADLSSKILEEYMDKCVKTNGKSPKDVNYEIIFTYNFLCPPKIYDYKKNTNNLQTQLEGQTYEPESVPETAPLLYISEEPELRHLLKHPVLTSFLHLKWFAIKRYYKVNLSFYIAFWALLTSYTLLTFKIGVQNSNMSLTQENVTQFSTNKIPYSNDAAVYLWVMVLGFLIALSFRELFQLVSSPITYLTSLENWLEICLIVLTSILMLCEMSCILWRNQISAIVILLSWGELILLVGRHPALATHLEMFKRVTKNFLQFLVWYSILIIAFALSFYMLFRNDNDIENKFNDPSSAMFKTIVMLTGEFDTFGSLPFNLHPIVSHALFLFFIFLIAIVLVNLLNGLAVSDTVAIRADAEIVAHVSRVKLVHYFETMAVSNPFSWIKNSENQMACIRRVIPPISKICTKQFYLKIRLFPDALQDSEIRILPNQRNMVNFGTLARKSVKNEVGCFTNCRGYYLDKYIVKEAKTVIVANSEVSEKTCAEILENFIARFDHVEKTINEIRLVLKNMKNTKDEDTVSLPSSNDSSVVSGSGDNE
ncbi:transient receptor potential cation channel protein painless [Adelges cooleyi]|uniref:transient receptor potential cation channel protein painless n=1 Tax=Adelges cooleyi TaxID=133065 RepID=UPI00217F83AE|nr:transient receptor potential cation channel protein painless [Adelges cooleyi]XP_050424283.1 transient receptor potential cation channel protein painless [Adelges cooleyi]